MSVEFNESYLTAVNIHSGRAFETVEQLQKDLSELKNKPIDILEIGRTCCSSMDDPTVWEAFLEINDKHIGDELRFDIGEMLAAMNEAKSLRERIAKIHSDRRSIIMSIYQKHRLKPI